MAEKFSMLSRKQNGKQTESEKLKQKMNEDKNNDNKDYWRIVKMFEGRDFD